jgi:uncharacterized protein (DUF983 family)
MCAEKAGNGTGLLKSILTNKCPRCRQGDLFTNPNPYNLRHTMDMPEECPVCGQKYELQTGFYFGTGFVSYGITVFLSAVTFLLWWFTIGMSIHDNGVFWWLGTNAAILVVLQPALQRLARSVWIAFFVRYDRNRNLPGSFIL